MTLNLPQRLQQLRQMRLVRVLTGSLTAGWCERLFTLPRTPRIASHVVPVLHSC